MDTDRTNSNCDGDKKNTMPRESDRETADRISGLGRQVLENCRNELLSRYPFLTFAFLGIPAAASQEIRGLGTDGEHLFFCPETLLRDYLQDPAMVRRQYLHQIFHCLYLHPFSRHSNKELWNLACDMAVERLLDGLLEQKRWAAEQVSAEYLLHELEEHTPKEQREALQQTYRRDDHGLWGENLPNGEGLRKKWEEILLYTARGREKSRLHAGMSRGNQEETLAGIQGNGHDYRRFLERFTRNREEVELDPESFDYIYYDYGMRHYGNVPLIEPLEYREVNRLEELVIAIDTSGSCSTELVRRFLEETLGILSGRENFFKKMKVYVIQCDCCIQKVDVIRSKEEWEAFGGNITICGRGGTDFRPVFRYIEELQKKKELQGPRALLYFTDGDGIYPEEKPNYETAFVFSEEVRGQMPGWAHALQMETGTVRVQAGQEGM